MNETQVSLCVELRQLYSYVLGIAHQNFPLFQPAVVHPLYVLPLNLNGKTHRLFRFGFNALLRLLDVRQAEVKVFKI